MLFQRPEPGRNLFDQVIDTQEVFPCPAELAFRLFLAYAEGHNTRGFLKNLSALIAFGR